MPHHHSNEIDKDIISSGYPSYISMFLNVFLYLLIAVFLFKLGT